MQPSVKSIKANSHNAICSNNLQKTADITSCECRNRTNLCQLSQRHKVVTKCRSTTYKLLLEIATCELALNIPNLRVVAGANMTQ